MTEQKVRCDKGKNCEAIGCYHKTIHRFDPYCKRDCALHNKACIPIEEIGYTLNEHGYSLNYRNPCPYNVGYINIGSHNGCSDKYDQDKDCQYFYGLDRDKQVIWCAYKHFNEEKPMFKIGDRVKIIKITCGAPEECLGRIGKIISICGNTHRVKFDYLIQDKDWWSFVPPELELINEVKMETKYKVIKEFTKYDYIVAHQKMYNWSEFKDSCAEFQKDMKTWPESTSWGYIGLKYPKYSDSAFSDNFYTDAVKFGFLREVKEEVYYHIGDRFSKEFSKYILARIDNDNVNLISLESGNRFGNHLHGHDIALFGIPASEFHTWAGKDMVKI